MRNLRKVMLWLHGWVGLLCGGLLCVMGLSGSALVFRDSIEPRVEPQLHRVEPQARRASWQQIYDAARTAHSQARVEHIFVAREAHDTHQVWLDGGKQRVFINPYTAQVLGTRGAKDGVFNWLADLHIHLLRGDTGHNVIGLGGALMLLLGLSGVWLWWPGVRRWRHGFRLHWRTNWRGRVYELHRVGGFAASGVLMMIALTGMALVWATWFSDILQKLARTTPPPKVQAVAQGQWLPLDVLVARAEKSLSGGRITRLSFPKKAGAPLIVRKRLKGELHPNGTSSVQLDTVSGRVLQVQRASQSTWDARLMALRYPLHIGSWGGAFTKVLWMLVGLTPTLLFISGVLMWWHKRRRRSRPAVRSTPHQSTLLS